MHWLSNVNALVQVAQAYGIIHCHLKQVKNKPTNAKQKEHATDMLDVMEDPCTHLVFKAYVSNSFFIMLDLES